MKKLLLFFVLALIISACDEKPTEPENLEDIDLNLIKFTPDSFNLKPGFSYIIEFSGINFTKAKIDSIIIDNKKLEIIEISESKIISKINNANPGTYQVELYQDGKVFILDKKIIFIPMEYKEPTKDNIYFLPDTIFIDENNKAIQFTLYGTDFEKYKIEEVYLNSKKCFISAYKDSLKITYAYTLLGRHDISFLYKGKKIILDKKLTTILKDSPLNLNTNNILNLEFRNIPTLRRYLDQTSIGGRNSHSTIDTVRIENNFLKDTLFTLSGASFVPPFNFTNSSTTPYSGSSYNLSIDPVMKIIKHLEYNSYSRYSEWTSSRESNFSYKFENLPYKIVEYNGNPQILVEVFGKDVDKCYPLLDLYVYNSGGQNTKYTNEIKTITRKDSITGKQINYYPATDSSYIRITIGN